MYEWAKRHLNWTLLCAWIIANGLVLGALVPPPIPTAAELSSMLLVYQDENLTQPWDSTNLPDLSNIPWSSPTSEIDKANGWQKGTLIAYLKNIGDITIKVDATDSEQVGINQTYRPGFGVSSNTITLEPKQFALITITISANPEVISWSGFSSTNAMIYFHIYPVAMESNNGIKIALIIIATIVMLSTEVWYLRRKRRSLFNLFWNLLNWIGFIIVLSLENKAISPASDEETKDEV